MKPGAAADFDHQTLGWNGYTLEDIPQKHFLFLHVVPSAEALESLFRLIVRLPGCRHGLIDPQLFSLSRNTVPETAGTPATFGERAVSRIVAYPR
jgi:hypothetical protein